MTVSASHTARVHELSTYTPICRSCGLILCAVNLPQYCCPDCMNPLVTGSAQDALIAQLESELTSTIANEVEAKERVAEEARRVAGMFPSLPPSSSSASPSPGAAQKAHANPTKPTHKVMSLTGSHQRVVVSSYMNKPPAKSTIETEDTEPQRVRPPAPPPVTTIQPNPDRPFENFIHGGVTYKPRPATTHHKPKSSRRKEKNERGNQENS